MQELADGVLGDVELGGEFVHGVADLVVLELSHLADVVTVGLEPTDPVKSTAGKTSEVSSELLETHPSTSWTRPVLVPCLSCNSPLNIFLVGIKAVYPIVNGSRVSPVSSTQTDLFSR